MTLNAEYGIPYKQSGGISHSSAFKYKKSRKYYLCESVDNIEALNTIRKAKQVLPMTEKDFKIDKLKDGTFRVTRIDISGDYHTHMKSKQLAKTVIHNVCYGKIPLNSRDYTLISMYRLSNDEKYRSKIQEILNTRKQKGKKDNYCNPSRYKSGRNF